MTEADVDLTERLLLGETLLEGGFLTVRRDTVSLPDGTSATREYVVHPGAVAVVPVLDDGRVVMVRQFRYPLGQVLLEFPAGKIDPGEAVRDLSLIPNLRFRRIVRRKSWLRG